MKKIKNFTLRTDMLILSESDQKEIFGGANANPVQDRCKTLSKPMCIVPCTDGTYFGTCRWHDELEKSGCYCNLDYDSPVHPAL